jgi:hypothetical protein
MVVSFLIAALVGTALPPGHGPVTWGMNAKQLQAAAPARKAELTDGFGYADHLEDDPDVYVGLTPEHERIEYYLFDDRLYKIYIVYERIMTHTGLYERLVEEIGKQFGPAQRSYHDELFGLPIQHTVWEDEQTILDLRKGAGFVYQVRTHKATAEKKQRALQRRKSI